MQNVNPDKSLAESEIKFPFEIFTYADICVIEYSRNLMLTLETSQGHKVACRSKNTLNVSN